MTRRREDIGALFAALGLHVAVLGALHLIRRESSPALDTSQSLHATSWEIEVADAPASEAAREPEAAGDGAPPTPSASESATAHIVPRVNADTTEPAQLESEPAALVEAPGESEPESPADATAETTPREPIQLGIGPDGWQRWVTAPKEGQAPRAEPAPRKQNRFHVLREPQKSTTGGLQEGLEEHDRTLGLGPHGRVLSALHQAAHTPAAPDVGVARFEVTVNRSGAVEVTLASATDRNEQWRKVAAHIASDLRAKPPRIPPPRERAKFVVELIAERTLPNGTKVTQLGKPRLDVPPPNFQSTEEAKAQLQEENPTADSAARKEEDVAIKLDSPGVYVAKNGTLGGFRAGLGVVPGGYRAGAGVGPTVQGTIDPSHIGAKPQRMIRARLIEQSLF